MNASGIARVHLRTDEGYREFPYVDTTGNLTIGIGRNLTGVGLHADEISLCFENDLRDAEKRARRLVDRYEHLSEIRKAVVLNMAFNLGTKLAGFTQTISAINSGRYEDAARNMLDSKWATQVGLRALRLADMMRNNRV